MLEHVSLPEAVTRALRHHPQQRAASDTRLVEANLAAEFGVSRGTIRDAMRSLHSEGLIEIVPRRYSVVTRMSAEDAEDVCYARYKLEDASLEGGLGKSGCRDLAKLAAAGPGAHVSRRAADGRPGRAGGQRHPVSPGAHHRLRLGAWRTDLWSMLNSQMGALMRAELDRQGIDLSEAVHRHRPIVEAVEEGDLDRLARRTPQPLPDRLPAVLVRRSHRSGSP